MDFTLEFWVRCCGKAHVNLGQTIDQLTRDLAVSLCNYFFPRSRLLHVSKQITFWLVLCNSVKASRFAPRNAAKGTD